MGSAGAEVKGLKFQRTFPQLEPPYVGSYNF
jgi:hypothetical protein